MQYNRLTKETMPPLFVPLVIWRGVNESDGGVCVMGKRVQYDGKEPYIRFVIPDGWKVLEEKEWRHVRWAAVEHPDERIIAKKG